VILLDQRLRLTRVLYVHFSGASSGQRSKRFFLHRLSAATIYAFEQVSNVANLYLAYSWFSTLVNASKSTNSIGNIWQLGQTCHAVARTFVVLIFIYQWMIYYLDRSQVNLYLFNTPRLISFLIKFDLRHLTALAFPGTQWASLFIVNWWYTTVDPGYTGDTVCG
jgi:hypothetical protein